MMPIKKRNPTGKQYDALRDAKAFWDKPVGEILYSDDWVALRELCYALEVLLGNLPDEKADSYDPLAYIIVLDALKDGELIAFALPSGSQIPALSWSKNNSSGDAFDEGFWTGSIQFDHHCTGFHGELPVVPWRNAEDWLKRKTPGRRAGRPNKVARAKKAYERIYKRIGHECYGDTQEIVRRKIEAAIGENISLASIKTMLREVRSQ